MQIGVCSRAGRGCASLMATIALVGVAFIIIGYIKEYQKQYLKDESAVLDKLTPEKRALTLASQSYFAKYQATAVSTVLAAVVASINMIMVLIVRRFSLFERHETKTKMNISVALKLGFLRFMTSSICYLLVHKNAYAWYIGADLIYDVQMILFFLAANPLIMLFDYVVVLKKCTRCWEKNKGDACKLTQREANELYEGSVIDVENNLSNFLNLILTCLFYSPIVPQAIPIALIGAVLNYWVSKWMLSYVHKHPDELSDLLTAFFVNLLPFASVLWAGAYIFFITKTNEDYDKSIVTRTERFSDLL